ncbi:MAG: YlxR family protein [Candidatus Nanopelagicales bacterium]
MTPALDSVESERIAQPIRTCVGCRVRADKSNLLRVTVSPTQSEPASPVLLRVDPRARATGRGAYVHPSSSCVEQAIRRRAFGRALRVTGSLDPSELLAWLAAD